MGKKCLVCDKQTTAHCQGRKDWGCGLPLCPKKQCHQAHKVEKANKTYRPWATLPMCAAAVRSQKPLKSSPYN